MQEEIPLCYLVVITRLVVSQPFFELTFKTIESGTIPYLSWEAIPQRAACNGEDILSKSSPSTVDLTVSDLVQRAVCFL